MVWKRTYVYERRVHFCYMFHQLDIYIMYIAHINKEIKFYNCKLHYIEAVILLEYGLKSRVTDGPKTEVSLKVYYLRAHTNQTR